MTEAFVLLKLAGERLGPKLRQLMDRMLPKLESLSFQFKQEAIALLEKFEKVLPAPDLKVLDEKIILLFYNPTTRTPEFRAELAGFTSELQQVYSHWWIWIGLVFLAALVLLLVPLAQLLLAREKHRRPALFISYHHSCEALARDLEEASQREEFDPLLLKYDPLASHQEVLWGAWNKAQVCDLMVSLPGPVPSFLDYEVSFVSGQRKPIIFIVSEQVGSLPNAASKTYPVFSLEKAGESRFAPVLDFCGYIAEQYRSTQQIYLRSLGLVGIRGQVILLGLMPFALWILLMAGSVYAKITHPLGSYTGLDAAGARVPLILVHTSLLTLLMLVASLSLSYFIAVTLSRKRQKAARKLASIFTATGQFNRDQWLGLIPGLEAGSPMYECLLAGPVAAHHERQA